MFTFAEALTFVAAVTSDDVFHTAFDAHRLLATDGSNDRLWTMYFDNSVAVLSITNGVVDYIDIATGDDMDEMVETIRSFEDRY